MDFKKAFSIGDDWYEVLKNEFTKPYFTSLLKFLQEEHRKYKIFPPNMFHWTTVTPLNNIKVVILGQDPYHGDGQAHGLSFSVKSGAIPPSLYNIFKELKDDLGIDNCAASGTMPTRNGNLEPWAKQGVLLLNAVLTVRKGEPNSHKDKGWEVFTDYVLKWVNDNTIGTVFILWGAYAQKKTSIINSTRHHVIKSAHPSPYSASNGFFGSKVFSRCNEWLTNNKKEPIIW